MKTFLVLRNEYPSALPPELRPRDVRYPEGLVERFLQEYTTEGDTVLDPFAGFGTTLRVAEAMERVPFGIEYDGAKCDYIRSQLKNQDRIIHGDSRQLASLDLPNFDFCMASPPYMNWDDREDPLTDYATMGQGYAHYLEDIRNIYRQIASLMKEGSRVVIEASNLKRSGVTPLAWGIAGEVGKEISFEGEIVIGWEPTYGYGYDHSYCLVFRK